MGALCEASGWRKSSYSGQDTNCVEVGRTGAGAAVRDSKDRAAGYVTADRGQWQAFLAKVKSGAFD